MQMELAIRKESMESVRPVFECKTCKAFPTIESVKLTLVNANSCACYALLSQNAIKDIIQENPLQLDFLMVMRFTGKQIY